MLFGPTERDVNPFLFQATIRPMKELVLTSAIHDKNVTMAKATQVSFIARTGLTSPPEKCEVTKTHRYNELGISTLSKQRFVVAIHRKRFRFAAVGTSSSAHHGCITRAIALHKPASSGQHRSPVCGPIAGPGPYAYEQVHEESQGTDHSVLYDPFLSQSPNASRREKRFSP